uniref:Uncharacterized protein n=1 Tax=Lutzomyia longipalpis TaxID=7200 RepID=A0A1B0CR11_LUTLO
MTMWQSGGMGHGTQNNPWMKLMGIVSHKERRHDNAQSQAGSNDRTLNHIFVVPVVPNHRKNIQKVSKASSTGDKN